MLFSKLDESEMSAAECMNINKETQHKFPPYVVTKVETTGMILLKFLLHLEKKCLGKSKFDNSL